MILATVAPQNGLKFNFSSLADPENWLHDVYYDVFKVALHNCRVTNGPKLSNDFLKKLLTVSVVLSGLNMSDFHEL